MFRETKKKNLFFSFHEILKDASIIAERQYQYLTCDEHRHSRISKATGMCPPYAVLGNKEADYARYLWFSFAGRAFGRYLVTPFNLRAFHLVS